LRYAKYILCRTLSWRVVISRRCLDNDCRHYSVLKDRVIVWYLWYLLLYDSTIYEFNKEGVLPAFLSQRLERTLNYYCS